MAFAILSTPWSQLPFQPQMRIIFITSDQNFTRFRKSAFKMNIDEWEVIPVASALSALCLIPPPSPDKPTWSLVTSIMVYGTNHLRICLYVLLLKKPFFLQITNCTTAASF